MMLRISHDARYPLRFLTNLFVSCFFFFEQLLITRWNFLSRRSKVFRVLCFFANTLVL